jgi:hypothetical protein
VARDSLAAPCRFLPVPTARAASNGHLLHNWNDERKEHKEGLHTADGNAVRLRAGLWQLEEKAPKRVASVFAQLSRLQQPRNKPFDVEREGLRNGA